MRTKDRMFPLDCWSLFSSLWPNTWQKQLERGRVCFGSRFESAAHHGREGVATGLVGFCLSKPGSRQGGLAAIPGFLLFPSLILFGTPAYGILPPTSRVISFSVHPLWKHPHRYLGASFLGTLSPVRLTHRRLTIAGTHIQSWLKVPPLSLSDLSCLPLLLALIKESTKAGSWLAPFSFVFWLWWDPTYHS